MNNFYKEITPEEAFELQKTVPSDNKRTLDDYKRCASITGLCEVCETEELWRYADTGMCFTCTTGEADASKDYELIYTPKDLS